MLKFLKAIGMFWMIVVAVSLIASGPTAAAGLLILPFIVIPAPILGLAFCFMIGAKLSRQSDS